MKRFFKVLILIGCFVLAFTGCHTSTPNTDKKINNQIAATTYLDQQISCNGHSLYDYSLTNGNDCIDKIYKFESDPYNFIDDQNYLEENYTVKYEYSFLDGNKSNNIKVQKYSRDRNDEQPRYCMQFFFMKDIDKKENLAVYKSFEIGTNGSVWDNEYFGYSYDDNDRLINVMYDDLGHENYFYYDEDGFLSCRTFGDDVAYYSYEKDEAGNILSVKKSDDYDVLGRYDYEYDSDNHIISEKSYTFKNNAEERLSETKTFSYNEDGNISIISTEAYDSDTESYKVTRKSYYYDDNNNISQIITEKNEKAEYMLFVYSENPNEYVETYG